MVDFSRAELDCRGFNTRGSRVMVHCSTESESMGLYPAQWDELEESLGTSAVILCSICDEGEYLSEVMRRRVWHQARDVTCCGASHERGTCTTPPSNQQPQCLTRGLMFTIVLGKTRTRILTSCLDAGGKLYLLDGTLSTNVKRRRFDAGCRL